MSDILASGVLTMLDFFPDLDMHLCILTFYVDFVMIVFSLFIDISFVNDNNMQMCMNRKIIASTMGGI